jgi:alpha-L-fucosidase
MATGEAKMHGKALYGGRGQAADADRSRLRWWKESRFGLFIHWGLYAVPAGTWNGKRVEGLGEWIMYNGKISVREYERLADSFNPTAFDARRWVALAKRAGMRYLVLTAKHHDGFALFGSKADRYNVVDSTPFGRDIAGELAEACREAGLRIGFYYSQDQDWHHPDGSWNDWDFDETKKDFDRYFRGKVLPQVTELLTNYGPVGLIWFDTPYTMTERYSRELRELVHSLQPECLVSGRVGNDLGDYGSLGDNQIPVGPVEGDYETPATMNDTWGYRSDDSHWKSTDRLLYLLIDLAGKGINYLLNVGPNGKGEIPPESVDRLEEIGRWLSRNGEAVYGTGASPFPWEFPWGRMTVKRDRAFLIFFEWPSRSFELVGLRSRVLRARTSDGRELTVRQHHDRELDRHSLTIDSFGPAPEGRYPVVTLEIDGDIDVDRRLLQQPDGSIVMPAFTGTIEEPETGAPDETEPRTAVTVARSGFTDEWRDTSPTLSFTFVVTKPGSFRLSVYSAGATAVRTGIDAPEPIDVEPHRVAVTIDGTAAAEDALTPEEWMATPRAQYFPEIRTTLGRVHIATTGEHTLTLRATKIAEGRELGISACELVREEDDR